MRYIINYLNIIHIVNILYMYRITSIVVKMEKSDLQVFIEENTPLGILDFQYVLNNFDIQTVLKELVELKGTFIKDSKEHISTINLETFLKDKENIKIYVKNKPTVIPYHRYRYKGLNELDLAQTKKNLYKWIPTKA